MASITKTSTAKAPLYFGALDGFRGALAVAVAIYHTFWYSSINDTTFFNNGTVLIDLFFVFSGFLMYCLYYNRVQTTGQAKTFMKRRFARLYPIHIFMLLIWVAFCAARILANELGLSTLEPGEVLPFSSGAPENFASFLAHLTLTHSMGVSESLTFNPPSWTISVEFFAYFVFVAVFMFCPPTKALHFAVMAGGVGLIYFGLSRIKPNMDITYDWGFFRCLGGFFTGVVAAWAYGKIKLKLDFMNGKNLTFIMTCVEILTLSAFAAFVIYMPGKLQFFVAPFAFAFVLVFAFDGGLISRFMSHGIFRFLAKISYSVYMIHAIFAFVFYMVGARIIPNIILEGHWAGNAFLVLYLIFVIGFGHMSWKYIERPGQKLLMNVNYSKLLHLHKKAVV